MKKALLFVAACLCIFTVWNETHKSGYPQTGVNHDDSSYTSEMFMEQDPLEEPDFQLMTAERSSNIGQSQTTRTVACHLCHGKSVCYHCDGDGFRNGRRCSVCSGTGKCTACDGLGALTVIELDGKDYTICSPCHGEGICGVCDGAGEIVYQFATLGRSQVDCSLCHGTGNCLLCKGSGLYELCGF